MLFILLVVCLIVEVRGEKTVENTRTINSMVLDKTQSVNMHGILDISKVPWCVRPLRSEHTSKAKFTYYVVTDGRMDLAIRNITDELNPHRKENSDVFQLSYNNGRKDHQPLWLKEHTFNMITPHRSKIKIMILDNIDPFTLAVEIYAAPELAVEHYHILGDKVYPSWVFEFLGQDAEQKILNV
jgi:hypothetical protein